MRQFNPGLPAFLELYVKDVDTFLRHNYDPIPSDESCTLVALQLLGKAGRLDAVDLARIISVGSA